MWMQPGTTSTCVIKLFLYLLKSPFFYNIFYRQLVVRFKEYNNEQNSSDESKKEFKQRTNNSLGLYNAFPFILV